MGCILAIDQSTSATKAVLFNAAGIVLACSSREHRQIYPKPGWVEHDAEEIWRNVLEVIREVTERNPDRLSSIEFLSLTNQRETVVVWDRATGQPLHNAIVWQCRRGDALCEHIRKRGHGDLVRQKAGLKLDTYFSASKLTWLQQDQPELAARLKNGSAIAGTIDSYLIFRLTGGKVFATDSTNASRTLLFNVGELGWDRDLCQLFEVPVDALPEVRESFSQFGETDANGILRKQVPICGVMGDSQASLFAQRCFQPGMAKATFGTGTSVLLNIGERYQFCEGGAVTALAWVFRGKPTYAFEGLINFSSATINWLRDQLGIIENAFDAGRIAAGLEDNGGVYLVPAFAGLSAPYWSAEARAAVVGMSGHTRREHLVRAGEEAIAYQIRDVLEMMRADAGVPLRELHADGGPVRDNFLMQFTADITGVELKVADVPESSAWGAATAGLLGMKKCGSLEELNQLPREMHAYKPQMEPAQAQKLYEGWKAAVQRVL